MAADLVSGLQLAVDAAIALLDPPGIPGKVEVEEISAVGLEVQALPRGVGRDQDPQRVLRRVSVEAPLDLLACRAAEQARDRLDPLISPIAARDRLLEDLLQVALGALAALGEDQDSPFVPARWLPVAAAAGLGQVRAHVLTDPGDQPPRLRVGLVPMTLGDLSHLLEQLSLAI